MALSYHGFGTAYYGEADRRSDGTFVATEWISAAYLPLIPLRSFRLMRNKEADINLFVFHSTGYVVAEKLALQWAQVLRVYLFLALALVWWIGATKICFTRYDIANDPRAPWIVSIWVLAMAFPICCVLLARRISSRSKEALLTRRG